MRFSERTMTRGEVDRAAGVIRGVKLLGQKSRNKRRYTADAMAEATAKYEGVKVYMGHPEPGSIGEERQWRDWAGVVENARFERGAIFGDIRLRKKSPHYEEILEAAEEFGRQFGMSHVADGKVTNYHGEEVIESISEVFSVDLVLDPATTAGLFEIYAGEREPTMADVVPKVRRWLVKALQTPAIANVAQDELESLAAAVEQAEAQLELQNNAEAIGFELQPHEIDGARSVHESRGYDCLGRLRPKKSTPEELRQFAARLR